MALSDGGGVVDPSARPSTILLLAVHHNRYRQLLQTFLAWKRRSQAQCERRKRVAAACRVGAVFCQRVFWEKWGVFVAERRQQRQEGDAPRLVEEERVASLGEDPLSSTKHPGSAVMPVCDGEAQSDQKRGNAAVLQRYFKRWKLAIQADNARRVGGIVRIRSLHAIRRWRGFVRVKKDRSLLEQRAYFFLYYWMLKRSLTRLGRHALIKKRERTLTVKIAKTSRLRLLVKTMQIWRIHLRLHQSLVLWQRYTLQQRHQAKLYRPIADELTRKTRHRLLQRTFEIWEKQHTRNQARCTLVNVMDRQLYRKVCEKAWRTWKIQVRQLIHLDTFQRRHQERRLRRVWDAWSAWTQEKERQEQLRRRAVRTCYRSLLLRGFNGFRAWRDQRQLALNRVDIMRDAADARIMATTFSRWDHFTSEKKTRALKCERAILHSESRLLKHVWTRGFRFFFFQTVEKRRLKLAAQKQYTIGALRYSFCTWKDEWHCERRRDEVLNRILQRYRASKVRSMKTCVLENWSEFTRAKAAKRVVNIQIRGLAQRRILQKHLSQWITYVSLLRWQQITRARAEQHYNRVILQKCLERWKHNVNSRQRYRNRTRTALMHWKLVLQRKVFDRWKQYLQSKRERQHRIHEALEFRHQQFVRDGLRHWMTASLHLQGLREQQVARTQASNTTQVWHRVAAIARHWRYLAIRRRTTREQAQVVENPRNALRAQGDLYWSHGLQQATRTQAIKPPDGTIKFRHEKMAAGTGEHSNWMNDRSPLSEFVLLPRNRPQPRRPVEVLLFTQAEPESENLPRVRENATTNTHEAVRCGFEFPAQPFAPLSQPPNREPNLPSSPRKCLPVKTGTNHPERNLPGTPALPSTTANRLDVLERQLLALSQRKREWKSFQQQLDALREEASGNPQIRSKLRFMEEQHAARTTQWLRTKGKIRSLATQIQELRSALQT